MTLEPGFTLPLSCGCPILAVSQAGSSSFNSSSNIIARTSSEVIGMVTNVKSRLRSIC